MAVVGVGSALAVNAIVQHNSIGEAAAQARALSDAGVPAGQAAFSATVLNFTDGAFVYEVEFTADEMQYEYEIDSSDGRILSKEVDAYDASSSATAAASADGTEIGLPAAEAIALKHAGLTADQVTVKEEERDSERGKIVYEITFVKDGKEYEYKIDAVSGGIVKSEIDAHD